MGLTNFNWEEKGCRERIKNNKGKKQKITKITKIDKVIGASNSGD
jgi:hypothetical protein